MITDPLNPEYNAKARDAVMDLCPFYDPHHKCGIVRENIFRDCLAELRERERLALESVSRLDALSSAGMRKLLETESKLGTDIEAHVVCDECNGDKIGYTRPGVPEACEVCGGSGIIQRTSSYD